MTATLQPLPATTDGAAPAVHARPVDLDRATAAVAELLDALGLDRDAAGLAETPRRVARMFDELLAPEPFDPTTFPNDAGCDELVVVSDIRFTSLCEHHLRPFPWRRPRRLPAGRADRRVVEAGPAGRRLRAATQVQERMTTQIAEWLATHLDPRGVGVVLDAEHLRMSIRGVRAEGARTVTSTLYGLLRDRPAARQEFLDLAHGS